jgi:Ca2+-binding EF-hand superfamily protein
MIAQSDTNKDGVLTADEWTKMNKDYSAADTDKDGRITPLELAAHFSEMK